MTDLVDLADLKEGWAIDIFDDDRFLGGFSLGRESGVGIPCMKYILKFVWIMAKSL